MGEHLEKGCHCGGRRKRSAEKFFAPRTDGHAIMLKTRSRSLNASMLMAPQPNLALFILGLSLNLIGGRT